MVVGRSEIMDETWERITSLLLGNGRRGGWRKDHCTVANGILWRLRTEAPWHDLSGRYGPWQTCYDRFVRWHPARDEPEDVLLWALVHERSGI